MMHGSIFDHRSARGLGFKLPFNLTQMKTSSSCCEIEGLFFWASVENHQMKNPTHSVLNLSGRQFKRDTVDLAPEATEERRSLKLSSTSPWVGVIGCQPCWPKEKKNELVFKVKLRLPRLFRGWVTFSYLTSFLSVLESTLTYWFQLSFVHVPEVDSWVFCRLEENHQITPSDQCGD